MLYFSIFPFPWPIVRILAISLTSRNIIKLMKYTIKSPRLFMLLGIRIIITHIIKLNILFLYIFNNFIRWWWLLPLFPLLFSNKSMQCHNFSLKSLNQCLLIFQFNLFLIFLHFLLFDSFLTNLDFLQYLVINMFLICYFLFNFLKLFLINFPMRFLKLFNRIILNFCLFFFQFNNIPNFFL